MRMRSSTTARLAFGAILAASTLTGGCTLLPGLFEGLAGKKAASDTLAPVTKESQVQSLKESLNSLQTTIAELNQTVPAVIASVGMAGSGVTSGLSATQYRTQGTYQSDAGTTVKWDDTTKLLTEVYDTRSDIKFDASTAGNTRTLTVNLARSADNTTGKVTVTVGAEAWTAMPAAMTSDGQTVQPPFYLTPGNELPDVTKLAKAEVSGSVVPKGEQAKAVELTLGVDTFHDASDDERQMFGNFAPRAAGPCSQTYDSSGNPVVNCPTPPPVQPLPPFKAPQRVYAKGKVPRLAFDQALTWQLAGASKGSLTLSGTLSMSTESKGNQDWANSVTLNADSSNADATKITFGLENKTQHFKLDGTATPKKAASGSTGLLIEGVFKSTDSGEQLAKLTLDTTQGDKYPTIEYSDGTKQVLKLDEGTSR